jgi:hypothetical protein
MGEVDISTDTAEARAAARGTAIVRRAESVEDDPDRALAGIAADLGPGPFAIVMLFVSPRHDTGAVAAAACRHLADGPVIGCTTAGEIGVSGYLDGAIVAVGLPSKWFRASVMCVHDLTRFEQQVTVAEILRRRSILADAVPTWSSEFVFMIADGLSMREEQLVSALSPALGTTPLFGGSAGDGVAFEHTFVLCDGEFRENRAVVVVLRTPCRIKAFRFDHLVPTDRRMVVTSADPARRIVHELNAEPAARAYARALDKDPDQLSPFLFAAYPVAVRIGDRHHVCSIQRVEENGDLRFFTAVDEGLVLTLANGQDIAAHLERSLDELSRDELPEAIIACECVLRRLEVEERQVKVPMSATLRRHRVVGFNSYGEQFNMLHVNQTFTGVAIYPPAGANGP